MSNFSHQAGKSRNFQSSPIERSSCHRIDFSTVSKTRRYRSLSSGMVLSCLENPVHDGPQVINRPEIVVISGRRIASSVPGRNSESTPEASAADAEATTPAHATPSVKPSPCDPAYGASSRSTPTRVRVEFRSIRRPIGQLKATALRRDETPHRLRLVRRTAIDDKKDRRRHVDHQALPGTQGIPKPSPVPGSA